MDWRNDYDWLNALGFAGLDNDGRVDNFEYPGLILKGPSKSKWTSTPHLNEGVAVALSNGENDKASWVGLFYGIHRTEAGEPMWTLVVAGCDYTGWDCQADGYSYVAETWSMMLSWGITEETYERLCMADHYYADAPDLSDALDASIEALAGSDDYDLSYPPEESQDATSSPTEGFPRLGERPMPEAIGRRRPVSMKAKELMGNDALRCLMGLRESFGSPETWGIRKVAGLWTLTDEDGEPLLCLPMKYASRDDAVGLLAGVVSGVATGLRLFDGELEGEEAGEARFS